MKRQLVLFIFFYAFFEVPAQTAKDVFQEVIEMRQEKGDSVARIFLEKNRDIFINENDNSSYLILWGVLTSHMWNENPTEELSKEYKDYLDSIFDDSMSSDSFQPDINILSPLWTLMTDYYNYLFSNGDKQKSLKVIMCLHRWFEPYPQARESVGYAQTLYDMIIMHIHVFHNYKEGEQIAKEYIDVSKIVYGEKSSQYALALYIMSKLPIPTSEKKEYVEKAISIYEVADDHNPDILVEMRKVYEEQVVMLTGKSGTEEIASHENGKYSYLECVKLVDAGRGSEAVSSLVSFKNDLLQDEFFDQYSYINVITLLIASYIQMGDFASAQNEYEEIDRKIGVENLPERGAAVLYQDAGIIAGKLRDYSKALRYLHKACENGEKTGEKIEYARSLGTLAITYYEASKTINRSYLLDAKWYIDEALNVFEEYIGPLKEHGSTGLLLLSNKSLIYDAIGDRTESIKTYEKIVSDFSGNEDVKEAWAIAANNLSTLYLLSREYDKCIDLLKGIDSPNTELKDAITQNIVLAYYLANKTGIRSPLQNYNDVCRNNCLSAFEFFSEAELENYWTYNARTLMCNNMIAEKYPEVADLAYDNILFTKRLTLMSAEIIKEYVQKENNPTLSKMYNRVKELRHDLKYRYNNVDSIDMRRSELREKERSLILSIPDMKERFLGSFRKWNEVKSCLGDDELSVEFVYSFKLNNDNIEKADICYGALVLSNNVKLPQYVDLGKRDDLERMCKIIDADALAISDFYSNPSDSSLYKDIWMKLEPFMKGKKTIYFSPTGVLNSINHDALLVKDSIRMSDIYNLVRVSSTSKIISLKKENNAILNSIAIFGGINYDESVSEMKQMALNYTKPIDSSDFLALRAEDERGRWNLLTGTKKEIENISNLFKSYNLSQHLYTWNDANEESFKAMDGNSPIILHLSTHGYYINTDAKLNSNPFLRSLGSYSSKDDMMARTGLLLSGANNVWTGKEIVSGIEDGILTAEEISRLDLKNTKLVVLSACETAKGQIDDVDGVLGLQRAFKKAGAGTIVMSLWRVPDIATSILMSSFYESLLQGKDARTSLKEAQKKLRENNDAYKDPYYWGAFVVLD